MATSKATQRLQEIVSNRKNGGISWINTPNISSPSVNLNSYSNKTSYPWLSEQNYRKLEEEVDRLWLKWQARKEAMDQMYQRQIKDFINEQLLDKRADAINEQAYKAAEVKNEQADAQLRMTQFSQALKRKYKLDATANDLDVFSDFVEWLWEEWVNLAWQYLSWENKKLRYDAGLETFGEKIVDFAAWVMQSPWKRGYNLVWQRADKAGKRWAEKILGKELEDAYDNWREATDITKVLVWDERADSTATKVWEVVGDIGSAIALTAPLSSALAPAMAWWTAWDAALLWAFEWWVDTLATQLGTQWNLDVTPTQAVLGFLWGAAWWWLSNKLANLPKNQQESLRKEASKYIEKSIKPTVKGKQSQAAYDKFIDDTLDITDYMSKNKKILEYTDDAWNIIKWELPKNLRETSDTLSNLKKYIYDQYNSLAQKAWDKWAKVNLNKLYQKLDDLANDNAVNLANPWLKNAIESYKNQLLQYSDDLGNITIQEAQDTMQYYNKILDAYFKNPWAMATDTSKNIVVANLKRGLADAVDDSMDDVLNESINKWSTASQQYRDWKQLYSKIKTIEDEVSKRALVEARKNTKWLSTDIIDALAWWNLVEWLLTQNPSSLVKSVVMKWINAYNKYLNSPNTQIRNLFNLVDNANNPTWLQNATAWIGNAVKSAAQSSAPIIPEAVVPWTIETLTND